MNIQRKNSAHHFRMQSEREQTLGDRVCRFLTGGLSLFAAGGGLFQVEVVCTLLIFLLVLKLMSTSG